MAPPQHDRAGLDERHLVEAAQRDPRQFAELYELYFERVWIFVIRRVADRETAQDITSEVFHSALRGLPHFESRGGGFLAWLYRIARNAIADAGRQRRREVQQVVEEAQPADRETEDAAKLFRLIRRLPKEQQQVLELRFVAEKSVAEAANALGRSEGAIKQLQFRAIRTLREQMGRSR
ncbi:MAG: sigma-70 family RNA polymerase sigma factor [Bryobacterales bacterium]|nr:sigma-70 family RNA polymerase sigma factor [Bryobacterales bacterium]